MKRPNTKLEWCGEIIAAFCVVALPIVMLFIGAALGVK